MSRFLDWLRGQQDPDREAFVDDAARSGQGVREVVAPDGGPAVVMTSQAATPADRRARARTLARRVRQEDPVTDNGPIYVDLPPGHARRMNEGPPPLPHYWTPPDVPLHKTVRPEDRPQPEPEPTPRRRPSKVAVNLPDGLGKPPAGDVPLVSEARGVELARKLRRRGVSSARWAKTKGSDRFELTVGEDEHGKAADVLDELAREQRR